MDWLRNNFERVALGAGIAVLLLSAFFIYRNAQGFHDDYASLVQTVPARPVAMLGKEADLHSAEQQLSTPPQWTFSSRSGLFVPEKHFIGPDGQPATLQTTEVHAPVPNEWFEQFSLAIADSDVLEQDPDGDGFTNLDEWRGHTNPTDKNSHPDYLTKLNLKSFKQELFRLVFASRTEDTFGINTIDLQQPTQFVKVGDTIAGTRFKVLSFTEKYEPDKYGTNVDVSELKLENMDSFEQLTLVKERVAISPSSIATFVYGWKERREFSVKKDEEFSLPPQTEIKYKLIDVQPNKAVIVSSQKPDAPVVVGPLVP